MINSITLTKYATRWGGFGGYMPLRDSLYNGINAALSGNIGIHAVYHGKDLDTRLISNSTIIADGPLNLNASISNFSTGNNPLKFLSMRPAVDPAYTLHQSNVHGSEFGDSVILRASETVKMWGTLRAHAQYRGTVDLGAGNDVYDAHASINSQWQHWRFASRGYGATLKSATVNMGEGDDFFKATASAEGIQIGNMAAMRNSKIDLGDGNDQALIDVTGSIKHGRTHAMAYSSLDAGAGDDDVLVGSSWHATIDLGEGDDNLVTGGTYRHVRSTFDGGDGIDTADLSSISEQVARRASRMEYLYGEDGVFGKEGQSATQSFFERSFKVQNGGLYADLSTAGLDDSFKWQGSTYSNFEYVAVDGGTFDLAAGSFV